MEGFTIFSLNKSVKLSSPEPLSSRRFCGDTW